MSAWQPNSERERAIATFTRCEGHLRRAREQARSAGEALRKALRCVTEAENALGDAAQRLERGERPLAAVPNARPDDRSRRPSTLDSASRADRKDSQQARELRHPGAAIATARVASPDLRNP